MTITTIVGVGMIVSRLGISFSNSSGLSFPLAIAITMMTITSIVVGVVVSWLSLSLAISVTMTITTIVGVGMVVSRLGISFSNSSGLSFPLAIAIAMMTITSIV